MGKYTYRDFCLDIIAATKGEIDLSAKEYSEKISTKATDFITSLDNKVKYNETHEKKNTKKGPSAETIEKANAIKSVLTDTAKTATEINAELGTNFSGLEVSNAVKFIEGVQTEKVIRDAVNSKGLKRQNEYTAYKI